MKKSKVIKKTMIALGLLASTNLLMAEQFESLMCKAITSEDLFIPKNVVGYTSNTIDLSYKFNFPEGAVFVKATNANTFASGNFRVDPAHHITFDIDGYMPVLIKAIHGGALERGKKDKIFIGQNSSSYELVSKLPHGLTHGENRNPGYYVKNVTNHKIYSTDFVWMSTEPEVHISFGTSAGGKFNSRIGLELCVPECMPQPCISQQCKP